ncbi:MAG: hypothetical protein V3W41_22205 [Planctomycetota bacterium]
MARLVSVRELLLAMPDQFDLLREVFTELLETRRQAALPYPPPREDDGTN